MIISYNTAYSNLTLNNGFGRAGFGIINALKRLGHKVYFQTNLAPIEFTFAQPDYFEPKEDQYQIILTPWESTELHPGWVEKFNSADETWATSDWVADVYEKAGVKNLTTVFPHGIESVFKPKLRKKQGPINFLSLGGPANRKGCQESFDAFREAFQDDPNRATLTIKAYQRNLVRWYDDRNRVQDPAKLPNVTVITKEMEYEELIDFQSSFDASIYLTAGEGWGFIPMETLAMGIPTVSTYDWCQYKKYIGDLKVKADLVDSPWPNEHPGKVYKPDVQDAVNKLKMLEQDYDAFALQAFKNSLKLHSDYDWTELTRKAFEPIEAKLS